MSLDTWVSLGTLVLLAIGLLRHMDKKFDKFDSRIDKLETNANERFDKLEAELKATRTELKSEFKEEIATLRQHVDNGFDHIDNRLGVLEKRTFDIKATGT